ncbi:uncharacterized protein LOC111332930 [Stylophora pistillata]|uniref:EF-hand domain-containing protein n=1 Tax=Stylophora pistillata TaxID=50429 RepID=A0A2B4S4B4_STYPI|nr:uncharacterized protein LOC111332930 [Stylophora pistillata]XP_022794153.1 uncharacterized protein LOC111332930 [Stylophora pistillata]PFX23437.1 hypothetical protein AWC38_SpisGene11990 [Stylophora pistillata]
MPFEELIKEVNDNIAQEKKKRARLKDLDLIVLDNSLRESTVGQLRGHTLENKRKIYDKVRKCGFQYKIVAAYFHMPRVDDLWVEQIVSDCKEGKEDLSNLFAFSEVMIHPVSQGVPDTKTIPVGLSKMKTQGLINPIIEIDLATESIDWEKFTTKDMCQLLTERFKWSRECLSPDAKILVNLRDFPDAMVYEMERLFTVVDYLASRPVAERPFGIMFEESTGKFLPEEVGTWTAGVRKIMDSHEWTSGHLLAHVHKKWALGEMVQLECLVNGANGIWASLCEEGAALGHACSTITLMNLVRMGNGKVLKRYNCNKLRDAASNVTEITTGLPPHPKQVIYGDRALDLAFDFGSIAGGTVGETDFDLAEFFGEDAPVRISTLASEDMILERLKDLFDEDPQFTKDMATAMKKQMITDLDCNKKEEYMSAAGIAMLFYRSGGKRTTKMSEVIERAEVKSVHAQHLIEEVRGIWNEWDIEEAKLNDDQLNFNSFYNGFMSPYFGCFKCTDTRQALQAINMDNDGYIDWNEFLVYLKWAMREYPNIKDVDELLSFAFNKGIMPAMRDEVLGRKAKRSGAKRFKSK